MSEPVQSESGPAETQVSFETSQGAELNATVSRLGRFELAFELYGPNTVLRASEVLTGFKILVQERTVYSGRAVVQNLVDTGNAVTCEVRLEGGWLELDSLLPALNGGSLKSGFNLFLQQWQKIYKITPEYKAVICDLQAFLSDLRTWLDQAELGIRSSPAGDRIKLEQELAADVGTATTAAIGELFERFEAAARQVETQLPQHRAAHSAFAKRLLHPLLLSSPFLYRTFRKPLGYAGDYEMVNMICRSPFEGSTLFAKIVNLWFLRQPPAEAHRNRIDYLVEQIKQVSLNCARAGRGARILSVGCGPAVEVQRFLAQSELCNDTVFTLIDFNDETAEHARTVLQNLRSTHHRNTSVEIVRKSVNQILKEAGRSFGRSAGAQYDLVYCAGLFDYLSDPICRRLSDILYDWVTPQGLFITTNVDGSNPRRLTMDYIMDWHLIYRDGSQLASLKPAQSDGDFVVRSDLTGVNIYFSAKKQSVG